jgi:hypothetical protein
LESSDQRDESYSREKSFYRTGDPEKSILIITL